MNSCCEQFVQHIVKTLNNNMYNKLQSLDSNLKRYANYPTLALNMLNATNYKPNVKPYKPHMDHNDSGMTTMVYFGEFEGGDLILTDLNITFKIKRGDVVLLNTKLYKHEVTKVSKGNRFGLVFFAGSDHFPLVTGIENKNVVKLPALKYQIRDEELSSERSSQKKIENDKKNNFWKMYKPKKKKQKSNQ